MAATSEAAIALFQKNRRLEFSRRGVERASLRGGALRREAFLEAKPLFKFGADSAAAYAPTSSGRRLLTKHRLFHFLLEFGEREF